MTKRTFASPTVLALCVMLFVLAGAFASATSDSSANLHVPTIDELLTIKTIGGAQISPDGKWVAYTVTAGDFKQDAFVSQIWLVEARDVGTNRKGRIIQLTRGEKSSSNPRWSPDGAWLAFTSNRIEDKNQIFVINPAGGEAVQLTKSETAISNFAWSEDSRALLTLRLNRCHKFRRTAKTIWVITRWCGKITTTRIYGR